MTTWGFGVFILSVLVFIVAVISTWMSGYYWGRRIERNIAIEIDEADEVKE